MYRIILTALIIGCYFQTNAQDNSISISYLGYSVFHPGLKVGTDFEIKEWDKTKVKRKKTIVKHKTSFLSPQVGLYFHPKNHTGVFLNAEYGVRVFKDERRFYKAYSLGLGYLRQFNAGTTYVVEEGSIVEKKSASRGYIMPSLNLEFGQEISSAFTWFGKFSLASKMKYNAGISADIFFEAGIKFGI